VNLYTLLTSLPAVTALAGQNIFPMVIPDQSSYPALTYQVIARVAEPTLNTGGLVKLRAQFESFAGDYATADTLRNAVISSISGFTGQVGDTFVQRAIILSQYDYYEDEIQIYRLVTEAYLFFAV
jgi:hypothetical protein